MKVVSIIGGGFCGTMVLYHLVQNNFENPITINFYDDHGRHGRGVAYSTPFDEHLLNVPASGMSALPDQPDHFLQYLGDGANPAGFYPRKVYGDYLYGFFEQAMRRVRDSGHTLNVITNVAPGNDNSNILIHAGSTSQPLWPGGRPENTLENIIDHPYGTEFQGFLGRCNACEMVLILGTGLSAVDVILSLDRVGYRGKIICISRHGLWPVVHGPKNKFWHWRKYIDSLRPYSNRIWISFPAFLQKFCLKNITFWNMVRHRMPPECHAVIKRFKKEGRLRTIRGRITRIESYEAYLQNGQKITGDAVINCLGFIDMKGAKAQLIHPDSYRIAHDWPEYMIGPPLFGVLIETSAVPELRVQAKDVVAEVMEVLSGRT